MRLVAATAGAASAVSSAIGLVAKEVDVQQVDADAACAIAAVAGLAAAMSFVDHGQDGARREQFSVLTIEIGRAHV